MPDDASPDGQRFLMIKEAAVTDAPAQLFEPRDIIFIQNWHEELKRLVPVD